MRSLGSYRRCIRACCPAHGTDGLTVFSLKVDEERIDADAHANGSSPLPLTPLRNRIKVTHTAAWSSTSTFSFAIGTLPVTLGPTPSTSHPLHDATPTYKLRTTDCSNKIPCGLAHRRAAPLKYNTTGYASTHTQISAIRLMFPHRGSSPRNGRRLCYHTLLRLHGSRPVGTP